MITAMDRELRANNWAATKASTSAAGYTIVTYGRGRERLTLVWRNGTVLAGDYDPDTYNPGGRRCLYECTPAQLLGIITAPPAR